MFARLANGAVAPERVIEGQATMLSRTMHGIAFDDAHDEIMIPVALSGAVLMFRGGASGEEAPLRVIQGSLTRLVRPHTIAVDPVNNEVIVGDPSMRSVFIYDRLANGNVRPKRTIHGAKTGLLDIVGVAVDPVRNVIVASSRKGGGPTGLFVFDRLADGDAAPKAYIGGPNSGLAHFRQVAVDSTTGNIYLAQQGSNQERPGAYVLDQLRTDAQSDDEGDEDDSRGSASRLLRMGFVAIYGPDDNGDIPPRGILKGPNIRYSGGGGIALNPKMGELYTVGGNGVSAHLVPELFAPLNVSAPTAADARR